MKPSGSNTAPPPEAARFFLDRSLGLHVVAKALTDAGYSVELHDHHFEPDAPDSEWIPTVGAKGWIILTKDQKIMTRIPELAAVALGKARLYALGSGQVTGQAMAESFLKAMPKILRSLAQQEPPYAAKIDGGGKISVVWTRKELLAGLQRGQWVRKK